MEVPVRQFSVRFMLTAVLFFSAAMLASPVIASATIEADLVSGTEALGRVTLGRALDRGPDRPVDLDRLSMSTHQITGQVTVIVESVAETGDMPSADDNDYTRINDAVQAVSVLGDGTTVRLVGFFDWNEEHAAASWALGSDGTAETDDDYSVLPPWGLEDVTIHAQELGDAVIVGPGDLPDLDWETFLLMWGGSYFGWTVENLDIRGFDWSIAMFYTTGADFDGVTIANNSIDVPADVPGNYSAGLGEPWQNVAIHFAGGVNQSIVGNEIILRGLEQPDTAIVEEPVKSAQVGMQSNTHGGDRYDYLLIADNFVVFDGWQTEIEEWVYGIWENGHAHTSNIAVVGNAFVNGHPDNDPAFNLQRAFRVTSHSSEDTTVLYRDNLAVGANIAIHWIGDNYTSNPPGTVLPVEIVGNTLIDNDTGIWVHTDDPVADAAPGSAAPAGPMSKAIVRHNRLVGNTVAVRSDNAEVNAVENWWGCNEGPGEEGCDDALYLSLIHISEPTRPRLVSRMPSSA